MKAIALFALAGACVVKLAAADAPTPKEETQTAAPGAPPPSSLSQPTSAATTGRTKFPVYGEVGLGFGKTLFFGDTKDALRRSYGGSFDPGTGFNVMMGFVVAPSSWRGVGVGGRIKGTFGSPVKGDNDDDYIFNFYALSIAVKAYPFGGVFNQGPYARLSAGFGQMTTKRQNETTKLYRHQYAIGVTAAGALGWTLPVGAFGLGLEVELEYSNRNGTADGIGATTYQSGQLGGNFVFSF